MKKIKHSGTISQIGTTSVTVSIISLSACASCESKSMCQMSERKEKQLEIPVSQPKKYSIGQSVTVVMQQEMGLSAVFWAYFMPFLVCISTLFGLSFWTTNELFYGCGALISTTIYYVFFKFFSKNITRKFVWTLE